ncbi:MAG: bifunctional 2-C-methyl-D-erythritol 4-phosphate cytidylyltransferase/2-C-methyl-D-erythritol 2,4-cyclodiphosphate synthase [Kordiimonadales bacterium]|nr:MAG: bifunctional 2-C-methyl-D-erythritol 4-phosphate cytidylyltransferase/2-C-methyl-D-erythritol 2,4-cyclodiphosphate synthase [Kordiimonadales bacterium]
MKKLVIIIVAAGRGSRAGEGLPKQYRMIAGKPLLRQTVTALQKIAPEAHIQVVIHENDRALYSRSVEGLALMEPVFGGDTRQQSVLNGLSGIEHLTADYVLIHDAARPFVSSEVVGAVLQTLENGASAVVPGVPIVDTIKRTNPEGELHTVDRDGLFAIQTPQGFSYRELRLAHEANIGEAYTDDGAVMEAAGHNVEICLGSEGNFKVTTAADFDRAETQMMLRTADIRVGSGYDVHRFEAGDSVWLCGVNIPHSQSLKGHSDADVALHAITDAVLAAIAEGDIGTHFPPSDEQWRGVESHIFLSHAAKLVRARSGILAHVSVIIICERPKIGPHMDAMRARIADILALDISRVSVQATTTEKLGFTGRGEGIAAQATATVRLPFDV